MTPLDDDDLVILQAAALRSAYVVLRIAHLAETVEHLDVERRRLDDNIKLRRLIGDMTMEIHELREELKAKR